MRSSLLIPNALQTGLARAEAISHIIPPMTDPQGRYWKQPSRFYIEVDDMHALMSKETFEALPEYSASNPSGVYPGKMWRRYDGVYDQAFLRSGGTPEWLLVWYGASDNPKFCSVNHRKVVLA